MTADVRIERGRDDDSQDLTVITALAGYRITTPNEDDVAKAFAAIELGWQGRRYDRGTGDFGAMYPVSWDQGVDLELSGGFRLMKYLTLEMRVQLPIWGIGVAAGITI